MTTTSITGHQGWTQYDVNNQAHTLVDASGATWYSANDPATNGGNELEYPVRVRNNSAQVIVRGGEIDGSFSLTKEWEDMYDDGNSAAVFLQDCATGSSVVEWSISQVWDGIRVKGTEDFLIERVHIDVARDDALENDFGLNGTVRDCLFENLFSGISFGSADTPPSAVNNVFEIDRTLVHMAPYLYRGEQTHGTYFKTDTNSPAIRVLNSIFAITVADHAVLPRLQRGFDRMTADSTNNYLLNLTDDSLPNDYPDLPASFTLIEGQTARDYWDTVRAAWIAGQEIPPPPGSAEILYSIGVDADTGVIWAETDDGAYSATVTVGVSNASDSDTSDVTITVA